MPAAMHLAFLLVFLLNGIFGTPLSEKCGTRVGNHFRESEQFPVSDESFIIGGNLASSGQIPWQVSIQDATGHYCGGTLISKDWVLTAGHCFSRGTEGLSVVLGTTNIETGSPFASAPDAASYASSSASASAQRLKVARVIVHPGFVAFSHKNDVALVRLASGAALGDAVVPACLPDKKDPSIYKAGSAAMVSGWGQTREEENPSRLRLAKIPLVSQGKCRQCYRASQITDNMVCAGKIGRGGLDACKGDSGGPMVRLIDGKFTVIGVVSWGYGCGRPNRPGVYIRTANYTNWIRQIIQGDSRIV